MDAGGIGAYLGGSPFATPTYTKIRKPQAGGWNLYQGADNMTTSTYTAANTVPTVPLIVANT